MIRTMSVAEQTLRAPAAHRAAAGLASPVIGYFVARLVLHWTSFPAPITYAVCLAISLALAWRAWSARVVVGEDDLTIVNTLASTSIARAQIRHITGAGRIESRSDDGRPASRLPAEALRHPWWTLRTGRRQYTLNREQLRSWLRVPPARRSIVGRETPGTPDVPTS